MKAAAISTLLLLTAASAAVAQTPSYLNFESGPVRPVAISPDGSRLFVTNIPDARIEVFDITMTGLEHIRSIQVGLEPVAIAARTDSELWVVNHLSDSVSIVNVESASVRRTLLVGDEPRDIVFAKDRAFITTAHRGQHRVDPSIADTTGAGDPQFRTPGIGRADVWVFDAADPGASFGGNPVEIVTLFGDTPRALTVSSDGESVYVGIFNSGNRTAIVPEGAVCDGFEGASPCMVDGETMPGGNPGPATNVDDENAPEVGLIVQYNPSTEKWEDELGRDWSGAIRFELPDYDVFEINATSLDVGGSPVSGVGTTLFNMAVNPVSGVIYVSNTEARNEVRFEGPGEYGDTTVQGHLAEARISSISGGVPSAHHLNSHIDYDVLPAPPGIADHSLATPLEMAVTSDGATLYVVAFGSAAIGVFPTAALEGDTHDPTELSAGYLSTRGGPAGLVLDEARNRLYVYTRFDHGVAVIDLDSGEELDHDELFNPEPGLVRDGRPFLYDARATSSNGEASCASCHIFGDMDHLAWDLGNPDESVTRSPIPIRLEIAAGPDINGTGDAKDFHPMKGPMTTQTLRGLVFAGAQHWRGDRSSGFYGSDPYDSMLSFRNFVVAFAGLVGRDEILDDDEMTSFAEFAMTMAMPPNPVRSLDGTLSSTQAQALEFYKSDSRLADGVDTPGFGFNCDGCHSLQPSAGNYGTDGQQSFENEPQIFKVPQLRNMYQKVGMFGMMDVPFLNSGDNDNQGPQVRGTGYSHDGAIDTIDRFFQATVFNASGANIGFQSDAEREAMTDFMLAFDTDLASVVGQQLTLRGDDDAAALDRFDLLVAAGEQSFSSRLLGGDTTRCDVIAKVPGPDRVRGYLYDGSQFVADDGSDPVTPAQLAEMAKVDREVTVTCVVPGTGERFGADRDEDGIFDGLEECEIGVDPECTDDGEGDGDGNGDGGCGCRATSSRSHVGFLAVLGLAAIGTRRRRYRRR